MTRRCSSIPQSILIIVINDIAFHMHLTTGFEGCLVRYSFCAPLRLL